jgi:hypothetical protein
VESEQQRSVQLLEKLVNQNSGTLNFRGVEEVGGMMEAELEPLGFEVRWIDMKHTGLAGLGASGGGAHAEGEFVNLDSIPRQAKRAAILMSRLARDRRP